jgi:hypothetical protein
VEKPMPRFALACTLAGVIFAGNLCCSLHPLQGVLISS